MQILNHRPPIINAQSPLRRIPKSSNARQQVFFDGIRFAIEIADLAYRRLRETLWQVSSLDDATEYALEYASAVGDAWLIVDSINRLRALCCVAPGIADKPYCRSFVQKVHPVKALRNSVQHLDGRVDVIIKKKSPVWGEISWAIVTENPPVRAQLHTLAAGSFKAGEHRFADIAGRQFTFPIDVIALTGEGETVVLSDLMTTTAEFVRQMEVDLDKLFPKDGVYGRDLHAVAIVSFNESAEEPKKLSIYVE